ncbi:organic cation transporter protein-like [Plodia interpunctella]|uniref:organic cation transporter protein-like n=1 Tax=Plodia interpunctella TaxID=58824 RepID=UPI002367AE9A|nr:organic cation transporter protein-like [Plodia interpunctella]
MVESVIKRVTNINNKDDKLSQLVGQFGTWQLILFLSVFLVKLSSAWVQMAILFLTPKFTFHCTQFAENSMVSTDLTSNSTDFFTNSTDFASKSTDFVSNSTDFVSNSTFLAEVSKCYKDCVNYEYDTSPMDSTIISEWDLVCERNWLASFTQMVLQSGILIGSIVFGFLSDRYGRKKTFLAAVTITAIVGFAIPFSPNYITFTILRFVSGFGCAGTMVVSFVLIMETVGPDYRELLGCTYQFPFIFGHMSIPLFAYYFRDWQTYSLAMAVPQALYLGYFFVLTESPRWLVSVGRVEQATAIVKRAAAINNRPTTKIEETLTKLSQDMRAASEQPKPNYSALFQRALLCKTLCCCFLWLITGTTYFGFNQYISQSSSDPFISVAAAGAIQLPGVFLSMWLLKHLGRKKTTILFFFLGGIFILALGYVPKIFWLTLTLGSLGVSCAGAVACTIYIYTTELFPTVVRNMAMGASSTSMRVGSMIAPFISNLSMTVPWLPTVIFGLAPITAGFVCFILPETRGKSLPDTLEDVKSSE